LTFPLPGIIYDAFLNMWWYNENWNLAKYFWTKSKFKKPISYSQTNISNTINGTIDEAIWKRRIEVVVVVGIPIGITMVDETFQTFCA
jgi:hypothetical protein